MKAASLALVAFAAWTTFASKSRADDTVRTCIAASTEGQTLRKSGKLLASRDQMIACSRDACPAIVRSHCARWLTEVDAGIPSVVIRAEDATGADVLDAQLSIDGQPAKLDGQPVRLDPGQHTVAVESDRNGRKEERVLLAEGEKSRLVTLRFPPVPVAAAPHDDAPAPRESGGTTKRHSDRRRFFGRRRNGRARSVAATYFGVTASSDLSTLKSTCSPHCTDTAAHPGRTNALLFDVLAGRRRCGGCRGGARGRSAFRRRRKRRASPSGPRLSVLARSRAERSPAFSFAYEEVWSTCPAASARASRGEISTSRFMRDKY